MERSMGLLAGNRVEHFFGVISSSAAANSYIAVIAFACYCSYRRHLLHYIYTVCPKKDQIIFVISSTKLG